MLFIYSEPACESIGRRLSTGVIMAVFLLSIWVPSSARSEAQVKITLTVKNESLDKVFRLIEKQSDYIIWCEKSLLKQSGKVTLNLVGVPIEQALSEILVNQPLSFSIISKTIVIREKEVVRQEKDTATKKYLTINGVVVSESGQPIEGANIVEMRSGKGTISNVRGEFRISGIFPNSKLVVTYIGYSTREVVALDEHFMRVSLQLAKNELDQVVVQGYGVTSQRLTTGNIQSISASEIDKQPVFNVLEAMQGRIAGLEVTPTSGYASGPVKVDIRGVNSLNPSFFSDPLYIIDGVPLSVLQVDQSVGFSVGSASEGFTQNGLSGPANGQSPLFSINPGDIENIVVLKDADATAIYGSRGANGVILITTKKGKAGQNKLDLNVYQGLSKVVRNWDMLSTRQYTQMRREAFSNDGIIMNTGNAPDLLLWDTTRYTDWQKFLWGGLGKATSIQCGISGGNAQNTYRVAGSYLHNADITSAKGANERASVSLNLSHNSLDQKLQFSLAANYSYAVCNMITIPGAANLPPNAPAVYNAKGVLNYAQWDSAGVNYPFSSLLTPYRTATNFLTSNLIISYQFLKGLSFKASIGYNNAQTDQVNYYPIASMDTYLVPSITGTAIFGNNKNSNWIIEPQASYSSFVGRGKLDLLLGGTIQSTSTSGMFVQGYGYTNDALLKTISNAESVVGFGNYGQYKYAGVFGRVSYNLDNKYLLNINVRRDGSSRFGPGRQYGDFGSVGVAWIISEESWVKRHLSSFISLLKIRGSYGTTGSDGVGDYGYLTRWSGTLNYRALYSYGGVSPLVPIQHSDSLFHWEVNKKLEVAINLGLFKDRINIEAAYYRNRCGDQLVQFPVPLYTGFSSVVANSPAKVQNTGIEFLVNARVLSSPGFIWAVRFNIAFNRNKLLAYPNLASSPYANTYKVGQSLSIRKMLHLTGVDSLTGQYTYEDINHDGTISTNPGPNDDRYAKDLAPKFFGGIGNSFSWKNFELSFLFYFKKQTGINGFASLNPPGNMSNQPTSVLDRWTSPGDRKPVARFTTSPNASDYFFNQSDGIYTDASFLRLQNLSFSYSIPRSSLSRMGMQGVRIYVQAQNLFVITGYKGLDPDVQYFGSMPPAKLITSGFMINF